MKAWWLCLALLAGPAAAMTSEDCRQGREAALRSWPMVSNLPLLPGVTADGWCRIGAAPLDGLSGLEWQAKETPRGFTAEARRSEVKIGEYGAFSGTISVDYDRAAKSLRVTGLNLTRNDGDGARVALRLDGVDLGSQNAFVGGLGPVALSGVSLEIKGRSGLVGEVLAEVFGVDRRAALSNFTAARDQRQIMQDAIDALPATLGDRAGRAEFARMIRAYPQARGTAKFIVPDDQTVAIGALLGMIILGKSPGDAALSAALADAGLTFRWRD